MCTCRYWSRRWVIQELLLAADVTIICGEHDLAWYFLIRLLRGLDSAHVPDETKTIKRIKATIPIMMSRYTAVGTEAFKAIHRPDEHSPMDLLTEFRGTDCEVLHDKVYSLMSLAGESEAIHVDYGCSPEDLVITLLIRMGWTEPDQVRTIAVELGFADALPLSFGGTEV